MPDPGNGYGMSFISELKRRNVIRVALLYLVASWLILQVADVGISILGLPDWSGRLVFLLLAIGFPLALVFSWAYEITPEGLKKEKEIDRTRSITDQTAKKLDTAVIVLLLLSLAGLLADRLIPESRAPTEQQPVATLAPDRSIAVLPFVNMSADANNEYFSDGLSEELLNLLAKIPELRVAARTSAFSFKGTDAGIEEIAERLKVAHVLEGSVRKSGMQIRITAQLINAEDGYHLWSDTWDRTLTDVFAIQDEIAAAVVDALKVELLGEIPRAAETDPQAFSLYLESKSYANRHTADGFEQAVNLLTQALAIDPEFSEGWSELASVQTNQAGQRAVPAAEGFARAKASAERALAVDPKNARAMSTLGWNAMFWDWDFDKAAKLIARARELEPGNASVLNAYAVLNANFGRTDTAISLYERALALDPLSMSVLANLSATYFNVGRFEDSADLLETMRLVDPETSWYPLLAGWLQLIRGNPAAALDHFANVGGSYQVWSNSFAYYEVGQVEKADAALDSLKQRGGHAVQIAIAYAHRGDKEAALEWLEQAYEEHDDWLIEIRQFAYLKSLHDDPRWDALLEKLGLTDTDAERLGL